MTNLPALAQPAKVPAPEKQVPATPSTRNRIAALDFTKGALVLIMVLYHWLDYFIGPQSVVFRYLRFLTPSFICISGFLISSVYFSKYKLNDPRLPKRLAQRGLKILGIFLALNVAISVVFRSSYNGKILFGSMSAGDMIALFVTGNTLVAGVGKVAAFYVLIPIAHLLLLSAGIVFLCRVYKYAFQTAFIVCLLSVLILGYYGIHSSNLELITIGLFGVVAGYIPIAKIDNLRAYRYALGGAYLAYLVAITLWNVIYPLQVVGVCLSLVIIYLQCRPDREPGKARRTIIMLGNYSLLGYILQILVLQLLHRALRLIDLGAGRLPISFIAAVALTAIGVGLVDRARAKSGVFDRAYRTVFA